MNIYKEIKEIAKCNSKIDSLVNKLSEKIDTEGIAWQTARFVSMSRKDLEKLELVDDDYYCQQYTGYIEDDYYGGLYFKTDVPSQYVKVYFEC